MLECGPESCLALSQRPPRLDLPCSEFGEKNRAANLAVILPPRRHGPAHPISAAVLAHEQVFLLGKLLAGEHTRVHVSPALRNVRKHLIMRSAHELYVWGKLEIDHESPRNRQVPHVTIEHSNGGWSVLDE